MSRRICYIILCLTMCAGAFAQHWYTHLAYNDVRQVLVTGTHTYVLSGGSMFSVDKQTEVRHYYTLLDGLSTNKIAHIAYDSVNNGLLAFHRNGYVNLFTAAGCQTISDLYLKDMTAGRDVRYVLQDGGRLLLAMPYGVQTYDMATRSFVDTYIIGPEATNVSLLYLCKINRMLYAAAESAIYCGSLDSNLVDYRHWQRVPIPAQSVIHGLADVGSVLYAVFGNTLYRLVDDQWQSASDQSFVRLEKQNGHAIAYLTNGGFIDLNQSLTNVLTPGRQVAAACFDRRYSDYWFAGNDCGLIHLGHVSEHVYPVKGPAINMPYYLQYAGSTLFMLQGGTWAVQYWRAPYIMRYDGSQWHTLNPDQLNSQLRYRVYDLMAVAADPRDANHYFVSAYGGGLMEMRGDTILRHFDSRNSPLVDASGGQEPDLYTRVRSLYWDEQDNIWMLNMGLRVLLADGSWQAVPVTTENGLSLVTHSPLNLHRDPVRPHRFWISTFRETEGLGVIDYGGTVQDLSDDRSLFRTNFTAADGSPLVTGYIYGSAVDSVGNVWLGTDVGLLYYPATADFYTSNTLLYPDTMPGETDNWLKGEKVNCVMVDPFNRKWVGTSTAGVYVLSADCRSIEYHFSTDNSVLPSNDILAMTVRADAGSVMIGTADGLAEFCEFLPSAITTQPWQDMQTDDYSGMMNGWTYHFSYNTSSELAQRGDMLYGLSNGAIFSLNTQTEEVRVLNRLSGLTTSGIGHIMGVDGRLVVAYADGTIDIIRENGAITALTDLAEKQLSGVSKLMADAVPHNGKLYLATEFGVLVLNTRKIEFSDWYQPLPDAYPYLEAITIRGDSIYAASATTLYVGALRDNLSDYNYWSSQPRASRPDVLFEPHFLTSLTVGSCTYSCSERGICRNCGGEMAWFSPSGPAQNSPYRLTFTDDGACGVMVPGGRWAIEDQRDASVMIIRGNEWTNISHAELQKHTPLFGPRDFTRAAFDPANPGHFYISSYAHGLWEFNGDAISVYNSTNSPIVSASPESPFAPYYERVDGVAVDAQGNAWMLNAGTNRPLLVKSPSGQWQTFAIRRGSSAISFDTPGDVLIDALQPNRKWMASARENVGIGLLDDGGTPFVTTDDKSIFRSSFTDTRGITFTPDAIRSMAQDHEGNIWVGTNNGLFVLPASANFFGTNKCLRPVINRTDGSGLADYVLGTEQINAIAVDGGNRIWFGTASSGAYLMKIDLLDAQNTTTVYHFTTDNSPLPSNTIVSLAIRPSDGEVFFGTDGGLVSFKSDASAGADDYTSAYAYPNPVRPDFSGLLTVNGLMENSEVRITDAAGNLVFTGTANGGTVVWNLRDGQGRRVRTGVYLVMCHSAVGAEPAGHTIVKVLVM